MLQRFVFNVSWRHRRCLIVPVLKSFKAAARVGFGTLFGEADVGKLVSFQTNVAISKEEEVYCHHRRAAEALLVAEAQENVHAETKLSSVEHICCEAKVAAFAINVVECHLRQGLALSRLTSYGT